MKQDGNLKIFLNIHIVSYIKHISIYISISNPLVGLIIYIYLHVYSMMSIYVYIDIYIRQF